VAQARIRPQRRQERLLEAVVGTVRPDRGDQEALDGRGVRIEEPLERRQAHASSTARTEVREVNAGVMRARTIDEGPRNAGRGGSYGMAVVVPTFRRPAPPPASRVGPRRSRLAGRHRSRLVLALALSPFLVSAVVLVFGVGRAYTPFGDQAAIELHTRDVGHHPVLLGPFSRDDWSHPGPALFYLLAVPYRLVAGSSIGLPLGALAINGASVAGMALVAKRRQGTPLLLCTLVGCALVVRALGPDFLADVWNPYIPVLPFGLLLFLTWAMTCGERWALPLAAGVASFCAQTHVGYVPMVFPLLAWGGVWLVVLERRRGGRTRLGRRSPGLARVGLITFGVLVLMWTPPLVEQTLHSPGNLQRVVDYFREPAGDRASHTLADGYRVVAGQFELTPEWVSGPDRTRFGTSEPRLLRSSSIPVLLVPVGIAGFVLWRRRISDACRLLATLAVASVLGVLSVANVVGPVYAYRLRWTWMLAMVSFVAVAWAAWALASERTPRAEARWCAPVSVSMLLVLATVSSVSAARADTLNEGYEADVAALVPAVMADLPPGDGDVVVRSSSFAGSGFVSGLLLGLERRGVTARIDERVGRLYGDHRVHRSARVRADLSVVTDSGFEASLPHPDLRLVAYRGTLPIPERARVAAQLAALDAAHAAGSLTDEQWLRARIPVLTRLGSAVAVFSRTVSRS
jgi:hypothetical protein